MKVALCLTGLSRCWIDAAPGFKQYVLDKYDTDVFFSIWSEVGYYTGKGYLPEQNGFVVTKEQDRGFWESGDTVNTQAIHELYSPKILHVEDFNHFEPIAEQRKASFTNAWTRPKNTISQAYMMYRGIQQILMYQEVHDTKYDLVIRSRPDVLFSEALPEFDPQYFYTLAARNKVGTGTGDWLQVGNLDDIIAFTSYFYTNLELMYQQQGVSCPHLYVENSIKANQLQWKEFLVKAAMTHSPNGPYKEPV